MKSMLLLTIAFIGTLPASESQIPEDICDKHKKAGDKAYLISGICFVVSKDKKPYDEAKVSCNERSDGHLAHFLWMGVYRQFQDAMAIALNEEEMYIGREYEKNGPKLGSWVRYEDNDSEKPQAENVEDFIYDPPSFQSESKSEPKFKSLTTSAVIGVGSWQALHQQPVNDPETPRKYVCHYGGDGTYVKQRNFITQCNRELKGTYVSNVDTSACFVKSKVKSSYDEAKFACNDLMDGHLAHIKNKGSISTLIKHSVINKMSSITKGPKKPFGSFIGVEQEHKNGEYVPRWNYVKYNSKKEPIIGEAVDKYLWAIGEPTNGLGREHVATVSDQGFSDEDGETELDYICQYDFVEEDAPKPLIT